eukprot:TRINITY_DN3882_c0_g3_i1.p1 TRINITY_DN3882_c0_g3~~TRINITY_DN3882_c0_g3_i1.p1  ORF type:complete len:292 (-),score=38.90 TRINITY_DN3882_c0_g3_i1:458-1333(-)
MLAARRCRSRLALAGALLAASGLACQDGLWYDVKNSEVFLYPLCEITSLEKIWVTESPTDYYGAQRSCEADGGRLIIIRDAMRNEKAADVCGPRSCWIGLEENTPGIQAVEQWTWHDGSAVSYTNWAEGEPNNYQNVDEDRAFINICAISPMDATAAAAFGIIWLFLCCGLPIGVGVTQGACLCYAHTQRTEALQLANQGKRAEPPSAWWRYCCGHAAIYYWEGCSLNFFIVCCLWPYFAICCWQPTQHPMENGMMVGVPVHVSGGYGYGGAGYGQPQPTVVGTVVGTTKP